MTKPRAKPSLAKIKFGTRTIEAVLVQTDLDNEKHTAVKVASSCPLDHHFYKTGLLDDVEHQAGEAFHQNWRRVRVGSDSVPDWSRIPGESGHNENDGESRARQWLKRVHDAVTPRAWEMLILVCGEERGFEDARRVLNSMNLGCKLPRHYMGPRFKEALEELALHMGLTQVSTHRHSFA